ncbi:MAG: HAMP domain-containing histidine kinase [Bacteroidales bacterium]|jgi:signal transduction histidine kinase|nr:HAMP domain-containing histidine kinase [Bacteroidales bacterium]
MKLFGNLVKSKRNKDIALEREKLLQHVHSLEEGICFFSADKRVEFHNNLFIQYIDTITSSTNNPLSVFYDAAFDELNLFLKQRKGNYFETQIKKQGKAFSLRLNIFEDESFEIILNDITKQEKTHLLKQELTSNIAHELRTPVTVIRGYLETLLEQPLDESQRLHFTRRAYQSTVALSELIHDMTLLTRIDEAPSSFYLESINLKSLLADLQTDIASALQDKKIDMQCNIDDDVLISGNRNLIYSIFRNLADNSIRYGGENILIRISKYKEDDDFHYISFYDTGVGIADESHLSRLFERFYRLNEGRTRDNGGSGLGLSIVKNAISFHNGFIVAKNRAEGGLEFLFSLPKA